MKRQINLQRAHNHLRHAQQNREQQRNGSEQQRIAMHAAPPIVPPLRPAVGLGVVERLLQQRQARRPVAELVDVPAARPQLRALARVAVQRLRAREVLVPAPSGFVGAWEEQCERAQRF